MSVDSHGTYLNEIIAYENGELDDEQAVALFQALIDNGMAWKLQGSYGRTAMALVEAGLCRLPRGVTI